MAEPRVAFVTVGTTRFDALTQCVVQPDVLQALAKLGYSELRVQYGHGQRPAVADDNGHGMRVVSFDFKPHLGEEMAAADLIIGHAGAGTILEALEAGKRMLVVINDALMDNHQAELAEQMEAEGYLTACSPRTLPAGLQRLHTQPLAPYTAGDSVRAARVISALVDEGRTARHASGFDAPLLSFAVASVVAFFLAYLMAGLQ